MPTYEALARFLRDYDHLTAAQREAFEAAVRLFVSCLKTGEFDPRLRVKRVRGEPGVWELTWAADGRATFQYGPEVLPGQAHVVWRRIGTHDVFRQP